MIVLIGFMGAGKTTVGRLVADELGVSFVDADEVIAARAGASIPEIFKNEGEEGFRAFERSVVGDLLAGDDGVVALGGGALGSPEIADLLAPHAVVHLNVSLDEAIKRVGDSERPMLQISAPEDLFRERTRAYTTAATIAVAVDGRSPEEIARELIAGLRGRARRVPVTTAGGTYEVIVGKDVLREVGGVLDPSPRRVRVLHQPSVERYAKEVADALIERGSEVSMSEVPDGDSAKDRDTAQGLWSALADDGMNKDDALVTVGGGAVSDLGGFVASTFMRGLRVVHVPTTLLGQVDAAIGGKTAINLPHAKNLVGTIHQPAAVVCDVRTLTTLPPDELRSGCAEVLKYGFISEPRLIAFVTSRSDEVLRADAGTMTEVVERCVSIKAGVVGDDELDAGRRKILNYGHTFGHAFEQRSGFSMRHGEAVAVGMMAAALTSQGLGWLGEDEVAAHRDALDALGLPTEGSYDLGELEEAWKHDKKTRDAPRFVLLRGLGQPEIDVEVPRDVLSTALARLAG
jgi:3-dehydroquinate synthase